MPVDEMILFDEASPARRSRSRGGPLFKASKFSIESGGALKDSGGIDFTRADIGTLLFAFNIAHLGVQVGPGRRIEMFRFSNTVLLRITMGAEVFWMPERK